MGFWKAKNAPAFAADKWERFGQRKPQQLPRPEAENLPAAMKAETKVDLPAAFRPISIDNSPGESFKLKPLKTCFELNLTKPDLREIKF